MNVDNGFSQEISRRLMRAGDTSKRYAGPMARHAPSALTQHATSAGAARNAGTGVCEDTTRGEIAEQGHAFAFVRVPSIEMRIETHGGHESQ
jgi:hypothetical protein